MCNTKYIKYIVYQLVYHLLIQLVLHTLSTYPWSNLLLQPAQNFAQKEKKNYLKSTLKLIFSFAWQVLEYGPQSYQESVLAILCALIKLIDFSSPSMKQFHNDVLKVVSKYLKVKLKTVSSALPCSVLLSPLLFSVWLL